MTSKQRKGRKAVCFASQHRTIASKHLVGRFILEGFFGVLVDRFTVGIVTGALVGRFVADIVDGAFVGFTFKSLTAFWAYKLTGAIMFQ